MKKQTQRLIIVILLTFILAYGIPTVLKSVFKIPRPCAGMEGCREGFSFPSRHTTIAFALAAIFSLNIPDRRLQFLAITGASAIGIWRIVGGYHTYVDIAGGIVIGVLVALSVQKAFKLK